MGETMFGDLASVRDGLKDVDYLADDGIASVVFLAEKLGKPVLIAVSYTHLRAHET